MYCGSNSRDTTFSQIHTYFETPYLHVKIAYYNDNRLNSNENK